MCFRQKPQYQNKNFNFFILHFHTKMVKYFPKIAILCLDFMYIKFESKCLKIKKLKSKMCLTNFFSILN